MWGMADRAAAAYEPQRVMGYRKISITPVAGAHRLRPLSVRHPKEAVATTSMCSRMRTCAPISAYSKGVRATGLK